ncbi:hypothetical protein [Candidatus Kuenenia stuttgartiensis]|uniref:hypothetical protein n=1 Tax=Kuenenia stuttgartiensis TaxID=174633 RepID=UPI0013EA6CE9|nr:hypothetical protein [Candidatus Kuenenia stuttgartiensis]
MGYSSSADFSTGVTWVSGLESNTKEVNLNGYQYIRFRVRFVGVWPDEKIEVLETNCTLQWADPDIAAGTQVITSAYVPFGQGSTTFGESQYFAWET